MSGERPTEVWLLRTSDVPGGAGALLSPDERERAGWFLRADDRCRFTAARVLARTVLGKLLGVDPCDIRFDRTCTHCGGPHGKPRISGGGPNFSISHSGDVILLGLAPDVGVDVGVDVETDTPGRVGPGARAGLLAPQEHRPADDDDRGWLVTWVRKEAVLKATGEGLAAPLSHLVVSGPPDLPEVVSWLDEDGRDRDRASDIGLADLDLGDRWVGAVACVGARPRPELRNAAAVLNSACI